MLLWLGSLGYTQPPPAIVLIQRATRELSCAFIYSGIVRNCDPLQLFDDQDHQDWWFGSDNLSARLEEAAREREFVPSAPLPSPRPAHRSPLLEARAKRATRSKQPLPANLRQLTEPENAEPIGDPSFATDHRGQANCGLCREQLERVAARRPQLETALQNLLDPKVELVVGMT